MRSAEAPSSNASHASTPSQKQAMQVKVWHPVRQDTRYSVRRRFEDDALRSAPTSRVMRLLAWLEERQHARIEQFAYTNLCAEDAATLVRNSKACVEHLMKDLDGNQLRATDKPERARDALAATLGALDGDESYKGCERIVVACADGDLILSLQTATFFLELTAEPTGPYVIPPA